MHYSTKMEKGGLVTLPQAWLDELCLKDGDWIALDLDDHKIRLSKPDNEDYARALEK